MTVAPRLVQLPTLTLVVLIPARPRGERVADDLAGTLSSSDGEGGTPAGWPR